MSKLIPGYETTFVTRVDMTDDQLNQLKEKVKTIITNFGGELVFSEDWGKRKLAYSIQKETRGHYTYFVYTGKAGVTKEIERNLKIDDHLLRYLSINLSPEFDKEKFLKNPESPIMKKYEPKEGDRGYGNDRGYGSYRERDSY